MKKKILFLIAMALLISVLTLSVSMRQERMSAQEVEELRTKYKVYGDINKVNPLIEVGVVKTTLKEIAKKSDTFVYGEVLEEVPVYSAKSYAKFYGYKIRVISDTKNIFSSGEEITIIANTVFQEYFPVLSKGMKVVLPIGEIKGKYYFELCAYYVTEDEFVISAFDEKEILDKEYSGIKLEKLLNEIKKHSW